LVLLVIWALLDYEDLGIALCLLAAVLFSVHVTRAVGPGGSELGTHFAGSLFSFFKSGFCLKSVEGMVLLVG